jgi:hypothetical protein
MKRRPKNTAKEREHPKIDPRFVPVIDAFSADPQVSRGDGTGFGSGSLKVNDKIFAMITSKGRTRSGFPFRPALSRAAPGADTSHSAAIL